MALTMKSLTRSLELRLIVPLAAIAALVLAAHALLGYWSARDQIAVFVRADLERSAALIESAMHDGMLLNRMDEVQARIERLGASPGFNSVRVYAKDGRISLSSQPRERGAVVSLAEEACALCHPGGLATGPGVLSRRVLAQERDGHDAQQCLTVIRNEPACATAGCHAPPPVSPVLGVLEVQMTAAPFDVALARARSQLVWTTAVLVLASGLVTGLVIRTLVHLPVKRLHEGTRRLASGDLDTRIEVKGRHELARLAEAFNRMVGDLRSAREEVERWSRTLEQKVEEKTDELRRTQQKMTQVETMVSLGKLSATVAHELNNPLSGILTYARLVRRELAELALDEGVRADLDRYLELVDKESVRCGGIVRNLLLFARGHGARLAPTDVNQVVEHSLMLVRHHLELKRIALETGLAEGDAEIIADQGQIQQVVLALLMNAIEAMQDVEGRERRLGVHLRAEAGAVELRVSDTGVGIPPELVPHIFEPFVTTKGEASGVGLGLSVVYGVVHGHRGEIAVASTPDQGTTFTVRLPRRPSGAPGPAAPLAAAAGGEP